MALWRHIKIWIILSIVTIFLVMGFAKPAQVYNAVQRDINSIQSVFGDESAFRMVERANTVFSFFFGSMSPAAKEMHVSDASQAGVFGWENRLASSSNDMIRSAKIELYHIILRVQIFLTWLPMNVLFCIAAFIDGQMIRKVKILSFRYTNPALYNTATHVAIFLIGSSLLLLHLPVALSIWFWPITGILVSLSLMIASMNLQRMGL